MLHNIPVPDPSLDWSSNALESSSTALAVSLGTMGVLIRHKDSTIIMPETGAPRIVWVFDPTSQCGKYDTKTLVAQWHDPEYPKEGTTETDEPWAYLKRHAMNHNRVLDFIKGHKPIVMVKGRGGKVGFFRLDDHKNQDTILRKIHR